MKHGNMKWHRRPWRRCAEGMGLYSEAQELAAMFVDDDMNSQQVAWATGMLVYLSILYPNIQSLSVGKYWDRVSVKGPDSRLS